ncbi:MAG: gamma-glutamylcyclotransferase family protein [Solirubrobacteraceae bacterium]
MLISYFAYGSNMDEQAMRMQCPSSRCLGSACIDEHRLAFTRRSVLSGTGVADVVAASCSEVWGVLYELSDRDIDTLDRKEGYGWAYTRERKPVWLAADCSKCDAIIYTVLVKERSEVWPSREYLDRLVVAAERHVFPQDYIATLKAIRSTDRE